MGFLEGFGVGADVGAVTGVGALLTAGGDEGAPVLGSGDGVSPPGDEGVADEALDGSGDAGPAVALGEIVVQPAASDNPANTVRIETTRAPRTSNPC